MLTIKYIHSGSGIIDLYQAERATFVPCGDGAYRGHIETHDDQEEIVIKHFDRVYIVNDSGQTVFACHGERVG